MPFPLIAVAFRTAASATARIGARGAAIARAGDGELEGLPGDGDGGGGIPGSPGAASLAMSRKLGSGSPPTPVIGVEGLRDFRRDLRRLEPALDAELRKEMRRAVAIVAVRAGQIAPKQSGKLAKSYRPFITQRTAGIRSSLPYAPVIEFGGTISPRGTPITFQRMEPVTRAVEQYAAKLVDDFGDAVQRAADRTGWRA
jgi:hypothetical protein